MIPELELEPRGKQRFVGVVAKRRGQSRLMGEFLLLLMQAVVESTKR